MTPYDAIINPIRGKSSPDLPDCAIMVATAKDLYGIMGLAGLEKRRAKKLVMSKLYLVNDASRPYALAGPLMGAPYAVTLLETLIAWGVRKVIFLGICGAISPHVKTGDIVLPSSAVIDEGTSCHYGMETGAAVFPSGKIVEKIKNTLKETTLTFHEGPVWTTDAVFRETKEKVVFHQEKGVLGVEMEVSALFSVGAFRSIDVSAILVVSDELSSLEWKPGFRDSRFINSSKAVQELMIDLCRNL